MVYKIINSLLNIKRRLNRTLFDQPSFYINGTSRLGYDADINIKVLTKENAYFIVENVLFKTDDGALSELKYNQKISMLTINLPCENQYFGIEGVIIIKYKLKNRSRYSAISPKLRTLARYNEELETNIPLNIVSEIENIHFT